jgi:hypothetical protein
VLVAPSPNVQLQVYGLAPPDADPEKVTVKGANPEVGLAEAVASRAALPPLKLAARAPMFGVPTPVTGSQPAVAEYPLLPVVTSWKTEL